MTQQCLQTWIIRAIKTLRQGIKRSFTSMSFNAKSSSFGFIHWGNNSSKYFCSKRTFINERNPACQIKEHQACWYLRILCTIRVDSDQTQSSSKKTDLSIAIFGGLISGSGHGLGGRWVWMKRFSLCWEYLWQSRRIRSATQGTISMLTKSSSLLKKLKNQNLQLEAKWVVKEN